MGILGKAVAASWVLAAALAAAQPAKPDVAAEAAAAMERARRQAAGPMRIILEASKARRKAGDAETAVVAEPVVKAAAVRTTGATPAQTAPADARMLVATTATGESPRTAARAPAAESPPAPQPAAQASPPDAAPPSTPTLSSGILQSRPFGAAVPALEASATPALSSAPLAQPAPLPFADVPPPAVVPAAAVRPRLLTMVEPELPPRVLDQLVRNATVLIDLTIRADGSVAKVAVLPPAPRQLERALAPTLEQWKFEPLPTERVHRVELVFNPER